MPAGRGSLLSLTVLGALTAFSVAPLGAAVLKISDSRMEPLPWSALNGWGEDKHAAAYAAFHASCVKMMAAKPRKDRAMDRPLRAICAQTVRRRSLPDAKARAFFQDRFKPVRIARLESNEGFLTGYYEPIVAGSRTRTPEFTVPVYRQPPDLIAGAPPTDSAFASRGGAWRQVGNERVPYHDRAAIEDGALADKGLEICWLKNPVDAFFMQIQGSARVRLQDGAMLRLNYAAHNGHPYTPVGRILIDRGLVPRDEMSMDRIRAWMETNPAEGKDLRRQNRSFVFFRVAELRDQEEAVGAQGIPLFAGRSIAVDRKLHTYGTPFWIDARLPLNGEAPVDPFRRLMIAQDTGSAIVGPARADIYFGAGDAAGRVAGRIKQPATFVMLVPRAMSLTDVRGPVPMPRAKPRP